jgi:rod shape determining protein RodA
MRSTPWRNFDFLLLGAVAVLTIFGITMIRSAVAENIELTQTYPVVQRQIIFTIAGFLVVFIIASIDYHLWASVSRPMYFITFCILGILFVVGEAVFGSARRFETGTIFIQPSEFAKIVIILVLANFFSRNQERIGDLKVVGRSLLLTLPIVGWIIAQPNLSTSIVIMVLWAALLWAGGLRLKHLLVFAGSVPLILAITIPLLVQYKVIQDYQLGRITSFLFPNPEARYGDAYNVNQALISIGSGGWFGEGYGQGSQVQLRFLKIRHSDYIFSAMAHEFGFIGTVLVLAVLVFVIIRCLRAARISRDTYGALICYGVAVLIAFQAMVNIGVNLRLIPATGLTLPFISYGGSSLLSLLIGIGLVESVIIRHIALEF